MRVLRSVVLRSVESVPHYNPDVSGTHTALQQPQKEPLEIYPSCVRNRYNLNKCTVHTYKRSFKRTLSVLRRSSQTFRNDKNSQTERIARFFNIILTF